MIRRLRDHYIICGYGRVGRRVGHEFRDAGVPYVVLDFTRPTRSTSPPTTACPTSRARDGGRGSARPRPRPRQAGSSPRATRTSTTSTSTSPRGRRGRTCSSSRGPRPRTRPEDAARGRGPRRPAVHDRRAGDGEARRCGRRWRRSSTSSRPPAGPTCGWRRSRLTASAGTRARRSVNSRPPRDRCAHHGVTKAGRHASTPPRTRRVLESATWSSPSARRPSCRRSKSCSARPGRCRLGRSPDWRQRYPASPEHASSSNAPRAPSTATTRPTPRSASRPLRGVPAGAGAGAGGKSRGAAGGRARRGGGAGIPQRLARPGVVRDALAEVLEAG